MTDTPTHTPQQLADAQEAVDMASWNGIVALTWILQKAGLVSDEQYAFLHESMSKPLSLPKNAGNPLAQDLQRELDTLFAIATKPV